MPEKPVLIWQQPLDKLILGELRSKEEGDIELSMTLVPKVLK